MTTFNFETIKKEDVKEVILKDNTRIMYELPDIDFKRIVQCYVGKVNTCRCGCTGKYNYTKAGQNFENKKYDLKVKDSEVNEKKVKFVLNLLKKHEADGIDVLDGYIYNLNLDGKCYTLYLIN